MAGQQVTRNPCLAASPVSGVSATGQRSLLQSGIHDPWRAGELIATHACARQGRMNQETTNPLPRACPRSYQTWRRGIDCDPADALGATCANWLKRLRRVSTRISWLCTRRRAHGPCARLIAALGSGELCERSERTATGLKPLPSKAWRKPRRGPESSATMTMRTRP